MKYDLVLKCTVSADGLARNDVQSLLNALSAAEFYPIDLNIRDDYGLMGFIGKGAAALIDYDYFGSGLTDFLSLILDTIQAGGEKRDYKFREIRILIL